MKALTVKAHEKKRLKKAEEAAIDNGIGPEGEAGVEIVIPTTTATADGSKIETTQIIREETNNEEELELIDQDETYLVCKRIFDVELEMTKKLERKKV